LLFNPKNKVVLNNKIIPGNNNDGQTRASELANAFFKREVSFGKGEI
jgi:hypothetical protein